jgi:cathepsin B
MVNHVNSAKVGWTAHLSPHFKGKSLEHIKALCGTFTDPEVIEILPSKEEQFPEEHAFFSAVPIPDFFDAREAFPECANVIGHIRDQANCGSCWAFSSTEAFNDRLCIASNGVFQQLLSPQDTVDCCRYNNCRSMGCKGGQPGMAWKWFATDGVVTGGDFGDNKKGNSCSPYQYHGQMATPIIQCKSSCSEKTYETPYKSDKHRGASAYALTSVASMQKDLMQYGSITAALYVHEDFVHYQSGVYSNLKGDVLGGHAIKIIGWGTENGQDYWLAVNSWTEKWGDKGTFKILRGVNECGIETLSVHGGHVYYYPKK